MYRTGVFRGGAIMGAISALDIALWDIKGKALGVPVAELLGGPCRDRARVYCHIKGETADAIVAQCHRAKACGFTAVGHLNPLHDEPRDVPYFKTHAQKIQDAAETVRRCRDAVGNEVDLCIELHRRLTPAEAVVLARAIEPYRPFFYEDPILPDSFEAMAQVAQKIPIPIATGERLHNVYEFQALLQRGAVQFARTSVCLCGGITGARKIAALAEAHYVNVVPHNPLSPVSLAACLQLDAAIPNFAIQEYPTEDVGPEQPFFGLRGHRLAVTPPEIRDGFVTIPTAPGIGVELVPDVEKRFPPRPREVGMRPHADGFVVDQ
jgi:galactonate dehydratase